MADSAEGGKKHRKHHHSKKGEKKTNDDHPAEAPPAEAESKAVPEAAPKKDDAESEPKKSRSKKSKRHAEEPKGNEGGDASPKDVEPASSSSAEPQKVADKPKEEATAQPNADVKEPPAASENAPASSSSTPAPESAPASSSSAPASSSSAPSHVPEFRRGKIFVNVPEAKELPGGNKINPYWKAIVNPPREKLYRSEPVHKTNNPKWESTGRLLLLEEKHSSLQELRIEIWSQGSLSFRTKLGLVHFDLRLLLDGIPRAGWFTCEPIPGEKKSGGGQVLLQLLYLPTDLDLTPHHYEFSETLHTLMRKGQRDVVADYLEKHKAEINLEQHDHNGLTPLQVAVELQDVAFIELLISKGAKIDGPSANGRSPLHYAVLLPSEAVMNTLVKHGASVNKQDADGNTPLHLVSIDSHIAGLKFLLGNGANLNIQNAIGDIAIQPAMMREHLEVVALQASAAIRNNPQQASLVSPRPGVTTPRITSDPIDIFLENKAGLSVAKMLTSEKVPYASISTFMRSAGIIDHREVDLVRKYEHRTIISSTSDHILKTNWKLSPQYALTPVAGLTVPGASSSSSSSGGGADGPVKLAILMHHPHNHIVDNQMQSIGLIAINSTQSTHFEPSFQQNFAGRASSDPLLITLTPPTQAISLIPFARTDTAEGNFNIVIFSDRPLKVSQLAPWKHIKSVAGKWEGKTAGGPRGQATWTNNPKISLSLPSGHASLPLTILIEQPKTVADIDPYSVRPYALQIGFYVYDSSMSECIAQIEGFRNSQESYQLFHFDTTKHKKFTIIPCTAQPGKDSLFSVTVFCDESFRLKLRE